MYADRKERRQIRTTLFAVAVFGVPCLWLALVTAGIYPLVVIALGMFMNPLALGVITLVHVAVYGGVFFALAHFAAAVICLFESRRVRQFITVVIICLIAVLPFLHIWGGTSHGSEFPGQNAFQATGELLVQR